MATLHGSTIIWSTASLDTPTTGSVSGSAVAAGILQSMSKSVENNSKTVAGANGETVTDVLFNTRHSMTFEVVPTARAAFPAIGSIVYAPNATDMKGPHSSRKWIVTGGSQNSTVDGETRYSFECEAYDSLTPTGT
jgi:hypothetical protein